MKIALDEILTFVLRRALNGQELARTTVTTEKDAFAAHMTDPDRDFISAVKIDVGADSVSIGFSTKRAATACIEVRDHASGQLVDSWMGSGFRQQHQRVFDGFGAGLAQDTVFDIRIAALKDIGGGRVRLGAGADNPEIRGAVKTGSRSVTFFFDSVYVRRDGDPGGAGEMTFLFGVGDVATRQQLGPVEQWGEGDIADGGERQLDRTITIDKASRRLWAQVNGWDSDSSFGDFLGSPFQGFDGVGLRPAFDWPGTDGHEYNSGAFATVTRHFDTQQLAAGRQGRSGSRPVTSRSPSTSSDRSPSPNDPA